MTGMTKAQIDVVCLCGDYTYPLKPALIVAEAEFSIFELNHHWNTVLKRRDRLNELYVQVMDKVGNLATRDSEPVPSVSLSEFMGWVDADGAPTYTPHPFTSVIGYEWECEYCPYLEQCQPPVIYGIIKEREAEKQFKLDNKDQIAQEKIDKRKAKLREAATKKAAKEADKAAKLELKRLKAEAKSVK
jgi:hypothetical protein